MRAVLPTLVLAGILLGACAPMERTRTYQGIRPPAAGKKAVAEPVAEAASREEPTLPQASPAPAEAAGRREAPPDRRSRSLTKPDPQAALPQRETHSLARRTEAAERLLAEGEERYRVGDWAAAGAGFGLALELLAAGEDSFGDIGWTRNRVEGRIRDCSERLMEVGFTLYRGGDLAGAIATWRKVEAFDPSFEDARRCIETATAQQRNLEKIN